MNLSEFYGKVGGEYEEVKSRLLKDERIVKYLLKFPSSGDYENLQAALVEEKWEDAFRYSHNLKGICMNLGLKFLFEPSSALCENLRGGSPKEDCAPMMAEVEKEFKAVVAAIGELSQN